MKLRYLDEIPEQITSEHFYDLNVDRYMILDESQDEINDCSMIRCCDDPFLKQLRVFRVLDKSVNPLFVDFTLLGFRKISPSYDRGRKTRSLYKCVYRDQIIVEKVFRDVLDEYGELTALEITFNWYCENGEIGQSKTEIVKSYNKYEAETERRKRRYRQFDYLKASVKGTPHESYIAMLVNHYYTEIHNYQDDALLDLDVSMNSETDETILSILNSQVLRNDGKGYTTVKKSIQYQIGTIGIDDI